MKMKIVALNITAVAVAFLVMSATFVTNGWNIPADYKTKKNTVKSDAKSIAAGKDIYMSKCKSCHADNGKKNGDFTTAAFKAKTDGEIYYMSFIGNGKMPNFEKKVTSENDRWSVVNFVRSMK